jgi:hypothetical protein
MPAPRYDLNRRDYDDYEMAQCETGDWVLASSAQHLSKALADMIAMYEGKKRDGLRLGNARAALNMHGVPSPDPTRTEP